MNQIRVATAIFYLILLGSVFAFTPTITVTDPHSGQFLKNQQAFTINFTFQDTDYNGTSTYTSTISYYPASDPTNKTSIITGYPLDVTSCSGTNFSSSQPCHYSWTVNIPSDGNYNVYAEVTDGTNTGNGSSSAFGADSTTPTISNQSPADGSATNNKSATISFTATDSGSGIDYSNSSNITMTVDGNPVSYTNDGSGNITYSLSNHSDASVPVSVTATDRAGNAATSNWSFTIDSQVPSGSISVSTYTPNASPTLSFTNVSSDTTQMKFSCDNTNYTSLVPYIATYNGFNIASGNNGCNSGEGSKTIYVIFKDGAGNLSSSTNAPTTYDNETPPTPQSLSVSVSGDTANLTWNGVTDNLSGITGYKIYRSTTNDASGAGEIATSTTTSYSNSGLSDGTYYFFVSAIDGAGNVGSKSASATATIGSGTGSSTPTPAVSTSTECSFTTLVTINQTSDKLNIVVSASNGKFYAGSLKGKFGTEKVFTIGTFNDTSSYSSSTLINGKTGKFTATIVANDVAGAPCFTTKTIDIASAVDNANSVAPKAAIVNKAAGDVALSMDSFSISALLDQLNAFLERNGYKADKIAGMASDITALVKENEFTRTGQVIEQTVNGETKYNLKITLTFINHSNHSSVKLIEEIPKSIASSASQIEASTPFEVVKDDPVIAFNLDNLKQDQKVEVSYWLKEAKTKDEASSLQNSAKADFSAPTILLGIKAGASGFNLTGLFNLGILNWIIGIIVIAVIIGLVVVGRKTNFSSGKGNESLTRNSGLGNYNLQRLLGLSERPNRRRVVQEPTRTKKWGSKESN